MEEFRGCDWPSGSFAAAELGIQAHQVKPCSTLTPDDQSTSTDNYLTLGTGLYVASDQALEIASDVIWQWKKALGGFEDHFACHEKMVIS